MGISINQKELINLMKSFYELTKIRIVFFDEKFNEIFGYPEKYAEFCSAMRKNAVFVQKCNLSVENMCRRCQTHNRLVVGQCHAGLTEVVAPLSKDNMIMGYIMFGQIRGTEDDAVFLSTVKELCSDCGLCSEDIERLALTVHYKTTAQIKAAAEIVNVFISYIYMKAIVNIKKDGTAYLIMKYIEENPGENLTVNELCKKFFISRTTFYSITKPYIKNGIAAYVREIRLEKAKTMLCTTDKTVEEISIELGFNDCNYFRRVFKKHVGISANKYRKTSVS